MLESSGIVSFADFIKWPPRDNIELLDGRVCNMPPSSEKQRRIRHELMKQLGHLSGLHETPFPVRLFEKAGDFPESVLTVLEPDICVVNEINVDGHGCKGVPSLVIEILTTDCKRRTNLIMNRKLTLYSKAGVPELWIVDSEKREVRVYTQRDGGLEVTDIFFPDDILYSKTRSECSVKLAAVLP